MGTRHKTNTNKMPKNTEDKTKMMIATGYGYAVRVASKTPVHVASKMPCCK